MPGLEGKRVRLFWNDMGKVLVKVGIVISEEVAFTQIRTESGVEAIPTCNVVRVEVMN